RGTADATTAVASGNISVAFGGQGVSWPLVEAGKARALALTGAKRSPTHPQTPTVGGWHCRLRDGGLGRHAGARRHGAVRSSTSSMLKSKRLWPTLRWCRNLCSRVSIRP